MNEGPIEVRPRQNIAQMESVSVYCMNEEEKKTQSGETVN